MNDKIITNSLLKILNYTLEKKNLLKTSHIVKKCI